MRKTIPNDLRRRIIHAYESGLTKTYEATAEMFSVGRATVNRLLRRKRETGDIKPKERGGDLRRVMDLVWVKKYVTKNSDARLRDIADAWLAETGTSVSLSAVWYAMHTIGWTHKKKTPIAVERQKSEVITKRQEFLKIQQDLDPAKLVFLDESGFRLGSEVRYGWSPRGEDACGKYTGKWETMTMIGAIALDGFRGFMTIDAGTSIDVFHSFVTSQLVPNLRPGDVVVMDNLAAHKNKNIIELIETAKASVLFLPPYSPEFNPIEKTWAKLKEILRRLETTTRDTFDAAVAKAMQAINFQDILGWILHAGYRLKSI